MKKFTQKQLLEEGFWDLHRSPAVSNIGRGLRSAGKGLLKTLDVLAPELTTPYKQIGRNVSDIAGAFKSGWQGEKGQIKKNLEDQGYRVGNMTKVGKNWNVNVQEITYDDTTGVEKLGKPQVKVINPEKTIRTSSSNTSTAQTQSNSSPYTFKGKNYLPDFSVTPTKNGNDYVVKAYQVDKNNNPISNKQVTMVVDPNHVVKAVA
jgi:hypothetical protein